jgi:hypothetical protein
MPRQQRRLRLDRPADYCIVVQGRLDASWSNWLNTAEIQVTLDAHQAPVTTMTGRVADQAALFGWLARLRDLGLPLLLVRYLDSDEEGADEDEIET